MTRANIRFLRDGVPTTAVPAQPTETLLDYLRLRAGALGTKEGCNEGDCGACTVALGRLRGGRLVYEPVNACIQLLGMVDGADLVTVDDLGRGGALHPVQAAMVEHHGSQCGFCTPGFVMSLFALYQDAAPPTRDGIKDALAGNLCRCTGYRPIVEAAAASCAGAAEDGCADRRAATLGILTAYADDEDVLIGDADRFFAAPSTVAAAIALRAAHPDATVVAGATDVGLWVTKQLRHLPKILWLGRIAALKQIVDSPDALELGAGVTYAAAAPFVAAIDPDLGELWRRIGSRQVRASGTVGGNIANGSPIGDTPPALIALGAEIDLEGPEGGRTLPLEDFFIAYGRQDRRPGELVVRIRIPKLGAGRHFRAFKLAKRYDQDISAVMAGFRFTVADGRVAEARIAFGGMAATPKRARATEAAAVGLDLADETAVFTLGETLTQDFAPIDDMRASAGYRLDAAAGLLAKALLEIGGAASSATRLHGIREVADVAG